MTYLKIWLDFLDAIAALGYAERGRLLTGMLEYASTGEEPQFSGNERIIWPMVKAQIDRDIAAYEETSQRRSDAGKKGGRPRKEGKAKKIIAFSESQDKDKDKDKEEDKDNISPPIPPSRGDGDGQSAISALIDGAALSDTVKAKLHEWLAYKGKSAYKLTGAKALISRVCKAVQTHGDAAVCDLIDESIANAYKGIVWDKLDRRRNISETVDDIGSFDTDEFYALAVQRGNALGKEGENNGR